MKNAKDALENKYIFAKIKGSQGTKVKFKLSFFSAIIAFLSSKLLPSKKNYVSVEFGDKARNLILLDMKEEFNQLREDFINIRQSMKLESNQIQKYEDLGSTLKGKIDELSRSLRELDTFVKESKSIQHEEKIKTLVNKTSEESWNANWALNYTNNMIDRVVLNK